MAEFVRKKEKGAVGKIIKAEIMHAGGPVDLSLLEQKIPENLEDLTAQIKDSHKAALGQMGRAVIAAARAGQLLLAAKVKLPKDKPFTDWLAETFEFSQRTAYNYMKVSEAMSRHAKDIVNCESIRDVLKLCDAEDAKKRKKDTKRESFVTWANKIERWWTEETTETPLADWSAQRRETCKKMLHGVAQIYTQL